MFRFRIPVIVLVCLFALQQIAPAQQQPQPQPQPQQPVAEKAPPQTVLRTYNISDLLRASQNYPVSPVPQQPGQGPLFGGQQPPAPEMIDSVVKLIMDVVDSTSWKNNGGSVGSIREML